jgi:hypothetical protein
MAAGQQQAVGSSDSGWNGYAWIDRMLQVAVVVAMSGMLAAGVLTFMGS